MCKLAKSKNFHGNRRLLLVIYFTFLSLSTDLCYFERNKPSSVKISRNPFQQNWIAFHSLRPELFVKPKVVDFPNSDLPKAGQHNAYCEVSLFKPLLVWRVT